MLGLNQVSVRPFSIDQDIRSLLALYSAVEAIDHEGREISEQALRAELSLSGEELTHDRWVVSSPLDSSLMIASALIKLTHGETTASANIIVHPDWRRKGLGSLLLTKIFERARQIGASNVQIYADTRQPAGAAFLHKHGFSQSGAYTELRLDQGTRLPPVIWPFGYQVRSYSEVQDISILTQAMNLSYIPLWGHHDVSEGEMATWLTGFNQQGLLLVFSEKGRVIGISRVEPSPDRTRKNHTPTGYIDAPGIVPQHRRLDLYRALLLTGVNWLRHQGQQLVEMESWGDKLEVLNMYRELGFVDMRQLVCHSYVLLSETRVR